MFPLDTSTIQHISQGKRHRDCTIYKFEVRASSMARGVYLRAVICTAYDAGASLLKSNGRCFSLVPLLSGYFNQSANSILLVL